MVREPLALLDSQTFPLKYTYTFLSMRLVDGLRMFSLELGAVDNV